MAGIHRDPGGVIGSNHVVEGQKRMLQRGRLDVPDIDPSPGNLLRLQGCGQGSLLNDTTTGRGDEVGIALHQCQFALANQAPGLGIIRTVDGNEIALRQERIEVDWSRPALLKLSLREIGIIGQHTHVEPLATDPRDPPAYIAQTDDPHGAPQRVPPLKSFAVGTPLCAEGAVRLQDVLGQCQHHGHRMLGHGLNIGARLIDDENPRGRTRRHIHGIISGSRGGDHQ
jgi:hypothetical protein